ncbi:MAG: hypothetical protein C0606_16030 [Hyphomicrobiales bacterium]|nr:MAG: hypothetical protein C0606_16030 [Hyphomicrobiales bacterium]
MSHIFIEEGFDDKCLNAALLGALGLKETNALADSVLSRRSTRTTPSPLDTGALRMLYDHRIAPGMPADAAMVIARGTAVLIAGAE